MLLAGIIARAANLKLTIANNVIIKAIRERRESWNFLIFIWVHHIKVETTNNKKVSNRIWKTILSNHFNLILTASLTSSSLMELSNENICYNRISIERQFSSSKFYNGKILRWVNWMHVGSVIVNELTSNYLNHFLQTLPFLLLAMFIFIILWCACIKIELNPNQKT